MRQSAIVPVLITIAALVLLALLVRLALVLQVTLTFAVCINNGDVRLMFPAIRQSAPCICVHILSSNSLWTSIGRFSGVGVGNMDGVTLAVSVYVDDGVHVLVALSDCVALPPGIDVNTSVSGGNGLIEGFKSGVFVTSKEEVGDAVFPDGVSDIDHVALSVGVNIGRGVSVKKVVRVGLSVFEGVAVLESSMVGVLASAVSVLRVLARSAWDVRSADVVQAAKKRMIMNFR